MLLATATGAFTESGCCPAPTATVACTADFAPVRCGDKQCVYPNLCTATAAGFAENTCCPTASSASLVACTANVSPVECGAFKCAYANQCLAEAARFTAADCAAPPNNPCWYEFDCVSCLSSPSGACSWEGGFYCTAGSCTSCVTPNYGGRGDDKASICALPEAQKPADDINCPEYVDCQTCISSNKCGWQSGTTCVENCVPGQNCVTPNYGGLGGDKSTICSFNEAKPGAATGCEQYNSCLTCLGSTTCSWRKGVLCTSNCPAGDDGTCVTPNYGGQTHEQICALPNAQPLTPAKSDLAKSEDDGNSTTTEEGAEAASGATSGAIVAGSLLGAAVGLAAMAM